jgi:hypothetical protein
VTYDPVQFVLDEMVGRFVDDEDVGIVRESPFELSSDREAGASGTQYSDTHV